MMNALKLGGLPLAVRKAVLRHATAGRRRGYVRVPVVGKHMCKGGRGRAARSPRAKGCRLAERVVRSLHGGGAAVQRSSRLLATGRSRRHEIHLADRRLSLSAGALFSKRVPFQHSKCIAIQRIQYQSLSRESSTVNSGTGCTQL